MKYYISKETWDWYRGYMVQKYGEKAADDHMARSFILYERLPDDFNETETI